MTSQWLLGVDVSKWQGNIHWDKLAQKAAFAFIKASQETFTDPQFLRNWQESQGRILRGAYHFWDPDASAEAQANYFIQLLTSQPDTGELPPVLDLEQGPATWDQVQTWMSLVEQALGRPPLLYTSPGFAGALGPPPQPWPLWVAHYEVAQPTLPPGWDSWVFWQFGTGDGPTYGVASAKIDLNWFPGNRVALVRFCLGLPWERIEADGGSGGDGGGDGDGGGGGSTQRYRITAYRLRVRSGPGTQYTTVGALNYGTVVEVDQIVNQGAYAPWGRIGTDRWISLQYAQPVENS